MSLADPSPPLFPQDYRASGRQRLIGDLPFFVSPDDVWSNPELFLLNEERRPRFVAGVPPDYFSADGQLWGNPVYDWEALQRTSYRWCLDRLRALLSHVDVVRLDHFRGFAAAWHVPGGAPNAVAYTGTHDNNTTRGWFEALPEKQKQAVWAYLRRVPGESREAASELMRLAWRSCAALAVAPLQDLLDLGASARMNVPGQPAGNWRWRVTEDLLARADFEWLGNLTKETNRSAVLSSAAGSTPLRDTEVTR